MLTNRNKDQRSCVSVRRAHSFVGLFLAGVLWRLPRVSAGLHVHGIDDVKEVLHHRHALQRRVTV